MKNSFESLIKNDMLAVYQNGYDGLLRAFDLKISTGSSKFEGRIELLVVSTAEGTESWYRVTIALTNVSFARIASDFVTGGGCVLYNGGRLLWLSTSGELVVDLDPGVAWLSSSGVRNTSSFLVVGTGDVQIASVD